MTQAFQWDGEHMVPLRPKQADEEYVIGKIYWLEEEHPRSDVSHNHEFAWLEEAWKNLPEAVADLYPTPEHLRKRALIDTGWYNEMIIDSGSAAAAVRLADALKTIDKHFSFVIVRGPLVIRRVAKSQSRRMMKKPEFQASKTAIMELIAGMIGVTPEELERNTGKAA